MPQKSDREYRALAQVLAPSEEEEKVVRGYATTFNQPYTLYDDGEVRIDEVVDPNAFTNTSMDDVIFQFDHEGKVYARKSNGTLELRADEHGLFVEANLGGTAIGRELYEEIKGGYINKMSFGFTVRGDEWETPRTENGVEINVRRITDVKRLFDVSAVSIPANDSTELSVRTLSDGVIERVKAERLERIRLAELEEKRSALLKRIEGHFNGNS